MLSYSLTKNVNIASCYEKKKDAHAMIDIVSSLCSEFKNVTLNAVQILNGWGIEVEVEFEGESSSCFLVLMKN